MPDHSQCREELRAGMADQQPRRTIAVPFTEADLPPGATICYFAEISTTDDEQLVISESAETPPANV